MMAKDKKTEELNEKDLDQVTGGDAVKKWNLENSWPSKASADGSIRAADGFLSSGHTTGFNIKSGGKDGT